jgi:hypothetical protein
MNIYSIMSTTKSDQQYAIICTEEPAGTFLSNQRKKLVWDTLDELLKTLLHTSQFADESILFSWKRESKHLASAREPYSWRAALDEIKNSDLPSKCETFRGDAEKFVLITDKPVMLKIAGEITNSLLHSYSSRHRISFSPVQRVSKVPS